MSFHLRLILLVLSTAASLVSSTANEPTTTACPISELPPHVRFKDGETSLYVDYAAEKDGFVPAYLVHAASHPGLFIRPLTEPLRQIMAKDGTWYRCDLCPDDFPNWKAVKPEDRVELPPGTFHQMAFRLHAERGTRRKVRFVLCYPERVIQYPSNEGAAVVDADDEVRAVCDLVYRNSFGAFDELAAIALGTIKLPHRLAPLRRQAIDGLAMQSSEPRRTGVLRKILANAKREGDLRAYRCALLGLAIPDDLENRAALSGVSLALDLCKPRAVAIAVALQPDLFQRSPPKHRRWTGKDHWLLVTRELKSKNLVLARHAMEAIGRARTPRARKMSLLEKIISNPRHPLLTEAIRMYAYVAEKAAAAETIEVVLQSPAYRARAKDAARDALQTLERAEVRPGFHNPMGLQESAYFLGFLPGGPPTE